MKVFIVGGTGAIGERAVRTLVQYGHEVRATARTAQKAAALRGAGAEPTDVNVYDVRALRGAMRGCEAVIRLTTKIPGSFSQMRTKRAWDETNRLRAVGSKLIVDAAQAENVPIYMQESFFSLYRDNGPDWIDERCPIDDAGGQDVLRSLLSAEAEAARMTAAGGIGVTLRFGAYYGNAMSQMLLDMARKRMLPQIGRGAFYVPSLHLDDAAESIHYALSAPSGLYNVCDDEPLLWRDFVGAIATAAGGPPPLKLPGFLGHVLFGYPWAWLSRSIRLNNQHFKHVTGWEPRFRSARDGYAAIASAPNLQQRARPLQHDA
jgi:nucleoside-diphosphate-sugar epimerase